MNRDFFIDIWESLYAWSLNSKHLYVVGLDSARYNKLPYDTIIKLLSLHFDAEQLDLIIWSIYDENPELPIGDDRKVLINNAHDCWDYVNKLKETKTEEL